MKVSGLLIGVIMIVLGVLVLIMPDLIKWFVAVGLIVMGIMAIVRK